MRELIDICLMINWMTAKGLAWCLSYPGGTISGSSLPHLLNVREKNVSVSERECSWGGNFAKEIIRLQTYKNDKYVIWPWKFSEESFRFIIFYFRDFLAFFLGRVLPLHKQILKTIMLMCTWHICWLDLRYLSSHILHNPHPNLLSSPSASSERSLWHWWPEAKARHQVSSRLGQP